MTWGFSFRGIHSYRDRGLQITDVRGRGILPGVYSKTFSVPSMHGQQYFGYRFDKRELDVNVLLARGSVDEFRVSVRNLANWLNPAYGIGELVFDDEPSKKYKAVITNTQDWEQVNKWGTSLIRFICPDPFSYALTSTTVNFSGSSASITNNGTWEAVPTFNLTFTASASEMKLTLGGKYFRIVKNFVSGNTLTVNCDTGAILVNGADARINMDINSDFFNLPTGTSTVTMTPSNVATGSVVFTERWL